MIIIITTLVVQPPSPSVGYSTISRSIEFYSNIVDFKGFDFTYNYFSGPSAYDWSEW